EEETKDEESFDPIAKTPENSDDEDTHVTLTLVNPDSQQQSSSVSSQFVTSILNATPDAGIDFIFETTSQMDVEAPTTVAPLTFTNSSDNCFEHSSARLPNFGSLFGFDHRLKTLEANFSEFVQTNQFAGAVSSILGIVQRYMDQRMNEAVKIIKEQVKEQVKVQVSKILPKIEQTVNEQLDAEVLTRSSNLSKTSYAVAADLSEMELKKILIEKMEGNKSIYRSDKQRNLYKALVEAYESDKIILDTYGEVVTLKRHRDYDVDKDEEPFAGSDQGSKRRREGKEPESTSAPKEKATRTTRKSTQGSKSQQRTVSESAPIEEPLQTTHDLVEPSHQDTLSLVELEFFQEEVYKATTDQLDWINPKGQQYLHNLLKPLPLIPNSRGRRVITFDHFINNDLEYLCGGASSRKYTTSVTKTKASDYGHIKWIEYMVPRIMWIQEPVSYDKHALWGISHWGRKRQQFYEFAVNKESARDVYSKHRIIAVTEHKIVEWHNYKHLDWITVRRDDEKLYKFKEGDFKRLRIQDIQDMLLLLVQGKLTNLTVKERFAFNVSLRMFTRSINKDKKNRLMRIDELHKFSDGTLNDVRNALDDRLKGIRMQYLPSTIWRKGDKARATAMIQAIEKMLKTRRIMRSLEKFVGRRLYEGDLRMLQRTI
nr:hypothetical protein [Tanacetum cinerariifolium]